MSALIRNRIVVVIVNLFACIAAPQIVLAQQVDPQKATDAQALFEQAMSEMEANQFASACKKFEEVTRLLPEGVGGKYMLGECYERLGRLASAWAQYSFAEQIASRLGQTGRASDAKARADALKPKLATLTVIVPESIMKIVGISVKRDAVDLGEATWGTAIYVDSGQHEVIVTAPGYSTWKKRVEVLTDGVSAKLVVPMDAIKAIEVQPKPGPMATTPIVVVSPAPDRTWQRPAAMAMTAVGAATIVAGGIFGGVAIAKKNESNADGHCDITTNECDDAGLVLRKQAVGLGNVSTGLVVAGAVIAGAGIVIWASAPKAATGDDKKMPAVQKKIETSIGVGPSWVSVRGTF